MNISINNDKYFLLFSNCIPVKGFKNSIIMDLQKNAYIPIPNLLYDILNLDMKQLTIGEVKNYFNGAYNEGINSFFTYLNEQEYGFFTNSPNSFPELNKDFLSPYEIISSIINFNSQSKYKLKDVLKQIIELGCQLVQIRIFNKIDISFLKNVLKCIQGSRVKIVEILLKDHNYIINEFTPFCKQHMGLKIIIHSVKYKIVNHQLDNMFLTNKEINLYQKEVIDQRLFISNIPFYVESKNFNVGLNRKVCIDYDGKIKNFVNHSKSFGNISNINIRDIINKYDFQNKWFLKNDIIEKCKDCEFRYMCMSNSDIEKKDSKYYKTDQCNYDPYEGKWKKVLR